MNNFIDKFGQIFGHKDIASYPELYYRKDYSDNLGYQITLSRSAVLYDPSTNSKSVDWNRI
jgi:hypothetical protein